jgi:probable F420-dependent oxidoreductase
MIDRPVRIALQLQPQHMDYSAIRETVAEAEELGLDLLYNWDHFYPLYGEPDGLHFECWSMLAAWAEQTSRVEIGALVSCNSYRNPDLLADMARTIDHISAGRLIFGIGAGWFQRDYDEYGYEFGTPGTRLDALAEALPRIEQRWTKLNPPPTRKIPVMIGGGGEKKTLRMVAKHADIWNTLAKRDELAHKIDVLKGHCDAIGRDPSEIEISAGVGDASPAELAESYHGLGVRQFVCTQGGPKPDLGPLREWLAWRDSTR